MLKRSLLIAAVVLTLVTLTTNYVTMQALSQLSEAREAETGSFRQLHLISDHLTRYLLAGDPDDGAAIEAHFATLAPHRELNAMLRAPDVDWEQVQQHLYTHRHAPLLSTSSATQLRLSRTLPRLRDIMVIWDEMAPHVDALEAIFVQSQQRWQQEPLPTHSERRELAMEARAHLDALFELQHQLHLHFNELSDEARNLFLLTNFLVYFGLTAGLAHRLLAYVRRRDAETSRVKAALHDNRAIYNAIIENSHEAVCVLEPDNLHVHHANPAFCALLDYRPDDLETLTLEHFDTSEFDDAAALLADFDSGPNAIREHLWRTCGGELKAVELSASQILRDGQLQWIVLIGRDLSEERRLQAHLTEVDRMAAVGLLASGVGHEINNPLAYIAANLDFVREHLSASPDPAHAPAIEAITEARQGADRVREIVGDLKHYATWEKISREDTADAEQVLDTTLRIAANQLRHRARVQRDYCGEALVRGSESRLGQVFLNLLVNAAHAIPEGRALDNLITVSTELRDRWVLVRVSDTGKGISEEDQKEIFSPFFTTKAPDEGSGLGLSICQHIVGGMGGRIEVLSAPGQGATFTLWLPRQCEEDSLEFTTDPAEVLDIDPQHRPLLLIIEDQVPVARALRRMLDDTFEVIHFERANDALAHLDETPACDAILCDLMMPQMTGIEFARELEAYHPDHLSRLIFMTGGAPGQSERRFMERRDIPCLDKPFEPDALRRLLLRHHPSPASTT
ncbi:response regulator [Lujinxingia vulgaris]|uniref:histidine kinase n=1 Tax=Lujinxingia vulgaris TaxID=2600176 RepID=A0A5C6XMQ9_9DELT|nr:hybrid sensor histidine kinase/response regulator [Lujinxingia vulgaris]TXD38882.1 response regulator [Lujinxingia vulgaris]